MNKILVIIPAYNEELTISRVIQNVHKHVPEADVLVVNDGSKDRTEQAAREAGAKVLTMPFNVGIGGGMQTGYLYAYKMGYDYAVQMDADGQHAAEDLPKLLAEASRADLIVGSRYVEQTSYKSSRMRRAGMIFFSGLVSFITRQPFTDTTSGYRVANRKVIALYASYYPTDYPEVESLVYLKYHGCTIKEIATEMLHREAGRSSITPFKSVYYMVKVTLAVLMSAMRYQRDRKARPSI